MSILVIAEQDQHIIKAASRSAIAAAKLIGGDVDVLIIGSDISAVAQHIATLSGVSRVLVVDSQEYANPLAENFAPLIHSLAPEYSHVIAAATSFGKNVLPRVAALLDVDMVSEVINIIDASTYVRPLYAGSLNATVKNNEAVRLLTVRGTAFDAVQPGDKIAPIATVNAQGEKNLSRFVNVAIQKSERPELSSARVIVTGGRSLGSAEKFQELIVPLATKLDAAIGATRAAVDAGFAPNEWQVGQTGTVVAPELYIAIGVSGAAQHIAGMKDSRVIVAINHDPDAQIFQWADYGLVADLFEATTELTAALN